MSAQSCPFGQHSNVVLLARIRQLEDAPQQNPDGTPGHCVEAGFEQVESLLKTSCAGKERAVMELDKMKMKGR